MNNNKKPLIFGLGLGLVALLSACAGLPDMDDVRTINLQTSYRASTVPAVDIDGDPELRPGSMAREALAGSMECDILFLFCAIVAVPIAAGSGAMITAADTLPEELAQELNDVTAQVARGLHMPGKFDDAMRLAATKKGLNLHSAGTGTEVQMVATGLWWEVSMGNNVALHLTVEVSARRGDDVGRRRIGYRGEAAPIDVWLAFDGRRIRDVLETYMTDAGEAIWGHLIDGDE